MAVKKKLIGGAKGKAQEVTGAKINPQTGIVAAAYPLNAAAPRRVSAGR